MKMIKKMCQYKSLSQQKICNGKIFSTLDTFLLLYFFVKKLETSVGNFSANNTESKGKQLKVSQFAYQSYQLRNNFLPSTGNWLEFFIFLPLEDVSIYKLQTFFCFSVFLFLLSNWIFNVSRKQEELKNF